MDQLRTGIGLRGYGQRDLKKEYQKEGYRLFSSLLVNVKSKVMGQLYRVQIQSEAEVAAAQEAYQQRVEEQRQMKMIGGSEAPNAAGDQQRSPRRRTGTVRRRGKIGRNDPCWCGSGKKYKKRYMASDLRAAREGIDSEEAELPEPRTQEDHAGSRLEFAGSLAHQEEQQAGLASWSPTTAACAGVFTQNQIVAAPVVLSRDALRQDSRARAVIINSGNANACTGAVGELTLERWPSRGPTRGCAARRSPAPASARRCPWTRFHRVSNMPSLPSKRAPSRTLAGYLHDGYAPQGAWSRGGDRRPHARIAGCSKGAG